MPACGNEWMQGVCEKPRVKCGECPNQAFLEVSDRALLDHLQGRHVMGVYPLLEEETCCFLAVDFDQGRWREDVAAYVTTAQRLGVTPAVERSPAAVSETSLPFLSSTSPGNEAIRSSWTRGGNPSRTNGLFSRPCRA